jgi:hypothetical protein
MSSFGSILCGSYPDWEKKPKAGRAFSVFIDEFYPGREADIRTLCRSEGYHCSNRINILDGTVFPEVEVVAIQIWCFLESMAQARSLAEDLSVKYPALKHLVLWQRFPKENYLDAFAGTDSPLALTSFVAGYQQSCGSLRPTSKIHLHRSAPLPGFFGWYDEDLVDDYAMMNLGAFECVGPQGDLTV